MATAIRAPYPVEAPTAIDIESDVLDSFDLRQKLQDAIDQQVIIRKEAELTLVRSLAKDAKTKSLEVENAFQKNEAWKTADQRAEQRIQALKNILSKLDKYISELKSGSPEIVKSALSKRLEALNKTLSEKAEATSDLKEQIKKIQAEIDTLPKAAAKKS